MKKLKKAEYIAYHPKVKLTINDVLEIYQLFKSLDEKSTITINNFELEDISEIYKISPPFELIDISMRIFDKPVYSGTYIRIDENRIILNISDNDDVVLLGLKLKIETILKNRENPTKKQSIICHDGTDQDVPKTNQNNTNKSIEKQNQSDESGFYKKHKSIIDGLIVGIVLIIIGLIVKYILGL